LVYIEWEPEVNEDGDESANSDEELEPLEQCTLEDVGWMKVPYDEMQGIRATDMVRTSRTRTKSKNTYNLALVRFLAGYASYLVGNAGIGQVHTELRGESSTQIRYGSRIRLHPHRSLQI
jgi:hypothetical protein